MNLIQTILTATNWSRKQLGSYLHVTEKTIKHLELGKKPITNNMRKKILSIPIWPVSTRTSTPH